MADYVALETSGHVLLEDGTSGLLLETSPVTVSSTRTLAYTITSTASDTAAPAAAGLKLGAVVPSLGVELDILVAPVPAVLKLGASAVGLAITSTLAAPSARLALAGTLPAYVGQVSICIELELPHYGSVGPPGAGGDTLDDLILAASPAGFWKLDEPSGVVAHDSSGNSIHLAASGAYSPPIWGQPASPPGATTARWVDNSTRVSGDLSSFTNDFTAGVWFNAHPPALSGVGELIGQGAGGYHSTSAGGWAIIEILGKFAIGSNADLLYADDPFSLDTWYFVVAVRDAGTWKLYVNGLLQASTMTTSPGAGGWTNNTWLGNDAWPSHTSYLRTADISYAFIANRVLSQVELHNMYDAGTGADPVPDPYEIECIELPMLHYGYGAGSTLPFRECVLTNPHLTNYWPMDDVADGLVDLVGGRNMVEVSWGSYPTYGLDGPFAAGFPTRTSIGFDGPSGGAGSTARFEVGAPLFHAAWSFESWVYPTMITGGISNRIFDFQDDFTSGVAVDIGPSDSTLTALAGRIGFFATVASSSPLPYNTWTHWRLTYDGVTLRLYINGVLADSSPLAPGFGGGSQWTIGNLSPSPDFNYAPFQGRISDFAIYDIASDVFCSTVTPSGPGSSSESTVECIELELVPVGFP